jgi:hypothetical protein
MSPRRRPPRRSDVPDDEQDGASARMASRVLGYDRIETGPDGRDWAVRGIPGQAAQKVYRCPGCEQEIRAGVPHVVAWPKEDHGIGVQDRRHWHTPCWNARTRRRAR